MQREIPEEFRLLCVLFDEGSSHNLTTCEARIEFALSELSPNQLIVVKDYLDELLSGNYTARQLTDLWESTPTAGGVTFWGESEKDSEPKIVDVFKKMHSMAEKKLSKSD